MKTFVFNSKSAIKNTHHMEKNENLLHQLVTEIAKNHMKPEDSYEVTAVLESMGWTDHRAAEVFQVHDVFELAEEVWVKMNGHALHKPYSNEKEIPMWKYILGIVRLFLRGAIFALPMAVSVIAMMELNFSLWSYQFLSVKMATSIAIGTIMSFVSVGGFMQSIGRRGFFYITQGYYEMAWKITKYFIFLGIILSVIISIALYFINLALVIFPVSMILIIILFYFFLNIIWLTVTVMYILRKEWVFTGVITLGIIFVYILFVLLHINIIISQLISLLLISIISFQIVVYFFRSAKKKSELGIKPESQKISVTLYSVAPYFFYGLLYFLFLFIDRIVAWSTNDMFMPYYIWFRGEYEVGLDFALLTLIIPMGIIEVILDRLMTSVQVMQKQYWSFEIQEMNRNLIFQYYKRVIVMFITSLFSAGLIYILTRFLNGKFALLVNNSTVHFVFTWGLISYVFIAMALMNAVILFSLSQPHKILVSIGYAIIVDFLLGFLLTRWFGFSYAVFGVFVGAVLFFVLSTIHVRQVFKKMDYYLYAMS